VSDGRAGNARQATALASALAAIAGQATADAGGAAVEATAPHDELTLHLRAPWCWLAPRQLPGSASHAFGAEFARSLSAPPGIAIGCGRQAALATRLFGDAGSMSVQILDPRLDPSLWDIVVAPQHDRLRGRNVITTLGSLHPVDDTWLARARGQFPDFGTLPGPRTAVLLGGSSLHARFDRMAFEVMASKLEAVLANDGGSVLLTTSRRTPRELRQVLAHRYDDTPGIVWRGECDQPNPYPGLLAWADRIVCSPDSVNMITEACATRVPVFVFDPGRVRGRPRQFLDALLASGRIRAMDNTLAPYEVEPLRETARVAVEVHERLTGG